VTTREQFMQALDDEMRGRASDLDRIMPVIVEFVGIWLETYDGPAHSAHPGVMAREWREEMRAENADNHAKVAAVGSGVRR
jgi:uncharacterized protein Usg